MNATVDLHSSVVPSTEYGNYKQHLKNLWVLQDHYVNHRDNSVFHNITLDLQDQGQDHDRFVWFQTGLVLRQTVSDYITGTWCHKFNVCSSENDPQRQKLWLKRLPVNGRIIALCMLSVLWMILYRSTAAWVKETWWCWYGWCSCVVPSFRYTRRRRWGIHTSENCSICR